jgi:hypothetical protein
MRMLRQNADMDKETLDILKADDLLSRVYQIRQTGQMATLFVAYFDTQRAGKGAGSASRPFRCGCSE